MKPTDVVARLRATCAAKPDAIVTDETSKATREEAPGIRDGAARGRRRWLGPFVAAAAAAALAVGVVAITHATGRHGKPLPAAATLSPVRLPSGPGKPLRHGEVGQRSDVPWRSVGRGWTVAEWGNSGSSAVTVYLVNPVGGRYTIATLPSYLSPVWSSDVRDVLLIDYGGGTTEHLDMVTGTLTPIAVRKNVFVHGVLPGRAFGVLAVMPGAHGTRPTFGILGPRGTIRTRFPTSAPGAGSFSTEMDTIPTPDGEMVLGGTTGIALMTATGHLTRVLALPAGSTSCQPHRLWSPTVLVASCSNRHGDTGAYLMPLDGSLPTRLSVAVAPAGYFGVENAWAMSGHTLVTLGTGCGPPGVELVRTDGTHAQFGLPRAKGTYGVVVPIQAYDTTIIAMTTGANQCVGDKGPSLTSIDINTHKATVLLGPGLNGGAVEAGAAWPGD